VVTLLYGLRPPSPVDAVPSGDELWLDAAALPAATGWELKPQGLCQGDVCVPVARESRMVDGTRVNVAALARTMEQPVVHDDAHAVWSIGESARARRAELQSLVAPDFTLPDLDGRPHRQSDYRGRKIFLVSWASW
jgi:hypothetical protein